MFLDNYFGFSLQFGKSFNRYGDILYLNFNTTVPAKYVKYAASVHNY